MTSNNPKSDAPLGSKVLGNVSMSSELRSPLLNQARRPRIPSLVPVIPTVEGVVPQDVEMENVHSPLAEDDPQLGARGSQLTDPPRYVNPEDETAEGDGSREPLRRSRKRKHSRWCSSRGAQTPEFQTHREYRQKIVSNYQRLHRDLYTMSAANFFVPSFLRAVSENTEQGFRNVMSEPVPGVFIFEMLQPHFCEMLIAEVGNIEKWVNETKFSIMRPNTMNKYGFVLDDFGMETMLDRLMEDFIRPMSKVFFSEVGGSTLDAHHGFVLEYGDDRDVDLSFHVDDSEVTLNVCLGNQFFGGELFFRGVRCDKHVNTETQVEEIFDYSHVPGKAILHCGRHRHGARATTDGNRVNLVLWCRSSVFRDLTKCQKDFPGWCGECQREKMNSQRQSVAATKMELLMRAG